MQPDGPIDAFTPGTYYLTQINDKHNRQYTRAWNASTICSYSFADRSKDWLDVDGFKFQPNKSLDFRFSP